LNPTKEEMAIFERRSQDRRSRYRILESLKNLPPVTSDGARIQLKVNIARPEELDESVILGIDGIGIWRTEFLFMEREREPNEEEQAAIYRSVSERIPDKWVDIRTLDIGSDKHLPYHPPVKEPNPSLGVRGIRFGLAHRNLLKTQLKAILRANLGGNLRVILPMVTMVEEVRLVREMIEHCMGELEKEGHSFNPQLPLGIMVEVPSTAYALDLFLPVSDFFSLGTNDLIQYFLGADRQSESLQDLLSPFHPSIVRFLRDIADVSLKVGKPISICGEMASQTLAVPLLIGLGFEQLSVPPPMLTEIKGLIRRLDRSRCHQVVKEVCALSERDEAKARLLEFLENS
jgi:phosphoenolpyruvate-protein phosphotransferase